MSDREKAIKWAKTYLSRGWDTVLNDEGIEGLSIKAIARALLAEVEAREKAEYRAMAFAEGSAEWEDEARRAKIRVKELEAKAHSLQNEGSVQHPYFMDKVKECRELEAKLAKAMETLNWYANAGPMELAGDCDFGESLGYPVFKPGTRARGCLAELRAE